MGPQILCLLHMWVGGRFSCAWKQLWVKFRPSIQNEGLNHSALSLVSALQPICFCFFLLAPSHLSQENFYITIHVCPPLFCSLLLSCHLFLHSSSFLRSSCSVNLPSVPLELALFMPHVLHVLLIIKKQEKLFEILREV